MDENTMDIKLVEKLVDASYSMGYWKGRAAGSLMAAIGMAVVGAVIYCKAKSKHEAESAK